MHQAARLTLSHILLLILATMYQSNFTAEGTALERTSGWANVAELADLDVRTVATSLTYPSFGCSGCKMVKCMRQLGWWRLARQVRVSH